MQLFLEVSTAGHTQIDTGFWEKEKTLRACVHACVHDGEAESRGHTVFLWWWGQYLLIGMLNGQHNDLIPFVLGKSARVIHRLGVASLGAAAGSRQPAAAHQRVAAKPVRLCTRVGEAVRLSRLAWGACVRRVGVRGGALAAPRPKGRERFLQSLLSAKGARRRPRERSSAGASGGLLPAGSGKADAVWNSTRQTATTSHNFILESRPAAAPAPASERTREHTLEHKPWARHPRGSWSPLQTRHRPPPRPVQPSGSLGITVLPSKSPVHCPPQCAPGGGLSVSSYNCPSRSPPDPRGRIIIFF